MLLIQSCCGCFCCASYTLYKFAKAIPYMILFSAPPANASGNFKTVCEYKFIQHIVEMAVVGYLQIGTDTLVDMFIP